MKIVFQKEAALTSIQPLQGVMSSKSILPILSHVILEAEAKEVRVIASDLELWISCRFPARIEEEGSVTIPGRRFFNIIRELPGDETILESGEDNVTKIRCQRSYFKMMGMVREEFPARPDLGKTVELKIKQSELKDLFKKTSYAISRDETRYVLNGLNLIFKENKVTVVATDGRRLALAEAEVEMPKEMNREIILPAKAVQELGRVLEDGEEVIIQLGGKQAAFQFHQMLLISRLIDGRFPNFRQVIPSKCKEKIQLPRLEFLQMVRRASLLTSEKSNSVKFAFSPGLVKVTAVTPEVGESREEMNIEYQGEGIEIAFNPHYIIDILKTLEEEESVYFELIDSGRPGIFRTDGRFLCVIMPMKLS